MDRIEKTVFISYRRTNLPWAVAIFQSLRQHGYDVFYDYDGVSPGDFERVILGEITARAHFLVLLTPSALERCSEPSDWLRREIETALANKRNIVPIMLEGFDFGTPAIASALTSKLSAVRRYSGLTVPPAYFIEAMEKLRNRYLNIPLSSVLHPLPEPEELGLRVEKTLIKHQDVVERKELVAQQWFERGIAAGDVHEKVRFFSEAIRLNKEYAEAYNNRGVAFFQLGDFDQALRDFNEAARQMPDCEVFNNRGVVRLRVRDFEGALDDFNSALRLKPENASTLCNRGQVHFQLGDLSAALRDYNEAIRLNPGEPIGFISRGNALCEVGAIADGLQNY